MKSKTAFTLIELLVLKKVKRLRPPSARGLAHFKTLRAIRKSQVNASRLGLRRPSAAFPWPRRVAGC